MVRVLDWAFDEKTRSYKRDEIIVVRRGDFVTAYKETDFSCAFLSRKLVKTPKDLMDFLKSLRLFVNLLDTDHIMDDHVTDKALRT